MKFAEALRNEENWTQTDNGADCLKSTGKAIVDLFGVAGALRQAETSHIEKLVAEAYNENAEDTMKLLFYTRDIRGGLGERDTFRKAMRYLAGMHKESVAKNIHLIGEYGRYDDLLCLVNTRARQDVLDYIKSQLDRDIEAVNRGENPSLLGKWMPNCKNKEFHKEYLIIRDYLGYTDVVYRKTMSKLKKAIGIVEIKLAQNRWEEIDYNHLTGGNHKVYGRLFMRKDEERYTDYLYEAIEGRAKLNAKTLYPYEIIEKLNKGNGKYNDIMCEAMWRNLPNYLEDVEDKEAMVIADVSGSMMQYEGRPLYTAVGLAIYMAEHNVGPYKDMFMQFSSNSEIELLRGETLAQKYLGINRCKWNQSTNIIGALDKILNIGIVNRVSNEDMIKSLIIVSDMQFNESGSNNRETAYDTMKKRYEEAGYKMPRIVFWNVASEENTFHSKSNVPGVQMASGSGASVFNQVLGGKEIMKNIKESTNKDSLQEVTAEEIVRAVLDLERYKEVHA